MTVTREEAADLGYIECLISDSWGINIPKMFCENFADGWEGIDPNDLSICSDPTNDYYWDAWDDITQAATRTDETGQPWCLLQDGDLFAVRSDIEIIDW